jgi:hypothetical protein
MRRLSIAVTAGLAAADLVRDRFAARGITF